jgi:hypothetical protein
MGKRIATGGAFDRLSESVAIDGAKSCFATEVLFDRARRVERGSSKRSRQSEGVAWPFKGLYSSIASLLDKFQDDVAVTRMRGQKWCDLESVVSGSSGGIRGHIHRRRCYTE